MKGSRGKNKQTKMKRGRTHCDKEGRGEVKKRRWQRIRGGEREER